MVHSNKIVVITGPTSSGKTDIAKMVAEKYNGAVVSADSRQVYQRLDLGTGKDKSFHQFMIDIANPGDDFSVVDYQKQARVVVDDLISKNTLPIITGGTGYYIDSIIFDYQFPDVHDEKLRARLDKLSTPKLHEKLSIIDSASAIRAQKNRRKLIRALEINILTNKVVPTLNRQKRYDYLLIVLDLPKEKLKEKIKLRLTQRLDDGLIDEVIALRKNVDRNWLKNLGLEYFWVSRYLEKEISFEEMFDNLNQAILKYAKKQIIWWKRYPDAHWINNPKKVYNVIEEFIKK